MTPFAIRYTRIEEVLERAKQCGWGGKHYLNFRDKDNNLTGGFVPHLQTTGG